MKQIKTLTVNGISYEIADPDAACIDDAKVGADAWSAKHIIDRLCPAFTETAPAVRCQPVEGYPLTAVSNIETAADTLRLWQGGKNLIDLAAMIGEGYTVTKNGVTITLKDGCLHRSGVHTADGATNVLSIGPTQEWKHIRLPAGTYSIPSQFFLQLRTKDNKIDSTGNGNKFGTFTLPEEEYIVGIISHVSGLGTEVNDVVPLVIVSGSEKPTEYEPYRGKTLEVSLGKTVQSGSYDWAAGILTDENGETTQYAPMEITALPGVNTLMGYEGNVTVAGRQDLPALLEALTS